MKFLINEASPEFKKNANLNPFPDDNRFIPSFASIHARDRIQVEREFSTATLINSPLFLKINRHWQIHSPYRENRCPLQYLEISA